MEEKDIFELTEEEAYELLTNGYDFSESEMRDLFEMYEVDEVSDGPGRWEEYVTTVIKVCGHLFAIDWERGLTESQEDYFGSQPYEVEKKIKVVEVADYAPIKKEEE